MKYVILLYENPAMREVWQSLPEAERAEGVGVYAALDADLAASGELVVSEALADPSLGTRVAVRDGRTVTSDGPFAEAKEFLAGFYLVECESAERAVEIAARIPDAEFGTVEVRPVLDLEAMGR